MSEQATCCHPECENTKKCLGFGPGGKLEWVCVDHIDYGMGRAFGPMHCAMEAYEKVFSDG